MNTHLEFKTGMTKIPRILTPLITLSNKVKSNVFTRFLHLLFMRRTCCVMIAQRARPLWKRFSAVEHSFQCSNVKVLENLVLYLPVKVITDVFKVGEKRHWAEEARQLIPCHRGEAAVFKGTADIKNLITRCDLESNHSQESRSQITWWLCVGF